MAHEYLTLQEVADVLGKSTQTIRRMIKKGDLKAERIRTPQGFQYAVPKPYAPSPEHVLTNQTPTEVRPPLTSQNRDPFHSPVPIPSEAPESPVEPSLHSSPEAFLENDFYILEPSPPRSAQESIEDTTRHIRELVHLHHKEKMMLITILERLQAELAMERQRSLKLENRSITRGFKALLKKGFHFLGTIFLRWGNPS